MQVLLMWALRSRQEDKGEIGTAIHRTEGLLNYVHMDVWGLTKTASLESHRYFFVDDLSRCRWVYTMRQKNEVPDLFVKWKMIMEKQIGRKIKQL